MWAFAPFRMAAPPQVDTRRPWSRSAVPAPARALAATGPAYEAMQNVGEQQFLDAAVGEATTRVRAGLPLRAEFALVGYLARKGGSDDAQASGSTGRC